MRVSAQHRVFLVSSAPPSQHNHLYATLIALAVAGLALLGSTHWAMQLEEHYIHALAPELGNEKLQGAALQKRAFEQPDLLVLYGSSELVRDIPNRATEFFQDYPTGFRVFPVGKPGATSLAVLQKIAAVGDTIRGKKVAYSVSPGWFFIEVFDPSYYEGNFSDMQAFELIFSTRLSYSLRHEIARRMILYPKTLDDKWLLDFSVRHLAGDSLLDRALFAGIWPLGKVQNVISRAQDHCEAALHIMAEDEKLNANPKRIQRVLKWTEVLKKASQYVNASAVATKRGEVARKKLPRGSRNKIFLAEMARAREWTDFELLLRVFTELGAKPLLLSMPIEDIRLEVYGILPEARTAYRQRLDDLVAQYKIPLRDFREHDSDPGFSVDFLDHLSAEGWLYYNQALDDFYHDRLSPNPQPASPL